uniref:Uncharacterized protein n=1 Tax=Anopheles christyi TaxID=43041 RepID=A0A182KHR2_9DIPT
MARPGCGHVDDGSTAPCTGSGTDLSLSTSCATSSSLGQAFFSKCCSLSFGKVFSYRF